LLLLTLADPATAAVLNKKARLRDGPSRFTNLMDWVDGGTPVSVTAEQTGWYQVVLPDGRQGWIWGEHLDQVETPPAVVGPSPPGGEAAVASVPIEPARPATLQDELRSLHTQLEGYSRDGGLVAKADIERLIDRIDRLSREQEELRQSLDDSVFTGVRTPMDGSAIAGGAFLTIGGIIGWVMARVSQRRRDRRGRIRL
jgi:hypothetical protein